MIKEGLDILVFPVHKVNGSDRKVDSKEIKVIYAYPIFSPKIIMAHLYFILHRPLEYFRLLIRNKIFGGKKTFWEGVYYAKVIKRLQVKHIHAHFAWAATDIARIISRLTGIPFSFTAHQSDIHWLPEKLNEKIDEAKFVLTCTKGNREYLVHKYGGEVDAKIFTVYHGADIEKFLPEVGEDEKEIDILSIGNLIKVKGFEYLVKACAFLKDNNSFRKCVIVGNGEEKCNLESSIDDLNLRGKIEIWNPVSHDEVINLYKKAKIFALPVTVIDGAPHGIPNVLAEAMAMELAVVTSNISHIYELVENGKDGILVEDKDPEALAGAIDKLLSNKELRFSLGVNARKKITENFDSRKHIWKIAQLLVRVI